jgi:hypothetical protein
VWQSDDRDVPMLADTIIAVIRAIELKRPETGNCGYRTHGSHHWVARPSGFPFVTHRVR